MNAQLNENYRLQTEPLNMPPRLLLGPGPSNVHPRVLQAMSTNTVGHMDPAFLALMDEIQDLLRYLWQTDNEWTFPVSGTGSAGMETAVANVVEPGDVVLVGVIGYFGLRLAEMARRYGADVRCVEKAWGEVFTPDDLRPALEEQRPAVLMLVQGETSSGAQQPLEGIGDLCHEYDCLLLVDTVASLGGAPFFTDDWGVDIAYSGSQKCLSCPPGLAPVTFGPRAVEKIKGRSGPVANWYLDAALLMQYWSHERKYHHTAPINMNYALREALRLIAAEGLEAMWQRHRDAAELFWEGLAEMGLECHVPAENRLPSLTTVRVPEGVEPGQVSATLLREHNIEIANGLGQLAGQVWRVGLMGYNARPDNVTRLLDALARVLKRT
jgi:alanine-glyoxylate transaminase/serine-glyoxylate transaminase/serine-pyruvate transaminase